MSSYKINYGDTLGGIADKYNTSTHTLASLNHISNPNVIQAGSTLRLPGSPTTNTTLHAPVHAAPKVNPAAALNKWLAGDTTYQQQLAEYNKSNSDYTGTYNTQVSQTNRDYAETQRELNQQAHQDRMDQQNDFAGRGILHSGVYADALGQYNTALNTKLHNLTTGKTDKLSDLSTQKNSFLSELRLQQNSAKQDAIRRRAQSLGL